MQLTRIDELLNAVLDGEAAPKEVAELQALTEGNRELAAQLADRIAEHRLLGLIHQPFDAARCVDSVMTAIDNDEQSATDAIIGKISDSALPKPIADSDELLGSAAKKYLSGLALGVTLALMLAITGWFFFIRRGDVDGPAESRATIATLLLEDNCVWESGGELGEGQRLSAQKLTLNSGIAIIRFDGGAELIMSDETSLVLRSTGRAELFYGDVVVRAEDGAEGFELSTPASPIVDLGTEFAVSVDRAGVTEVQVLEGKIAYQNKGAADILSAGKAVRLSEKNQSAEHIELNSLRFNEVVKRANPKSQPQRMVVYEGFHYDEGRLPLEKTTKGIGWAGTWRLRLPKERQLPATEDSPEYFDIVHGQMNVTWPVPGGRLGMLSLPAGQTYYVRPMKRSIDLDRNGVTFFSLMVRETERPDQQGRPRERVRLTFRSLTDYFHEYVSFGHISGYRPHIRTCDEVLHTSPIVLPAEQTTLWIGKIVAREEGEDEIYFRVYGEDDVLGYAEPATWHVATRGVKLNAHLDCVLLSSEGATERIIDELRIGPTWRSVAPMLEEPN